MNWIKIKIAATPKNIDFVSAVFEEAGITSLEIEDNEEFLQVLEQTKPQWDFVEDSLYEEKSKACSVSGYVTDDENGRAVLKFIENKINAVLCHTGLDPVSPEIAGQARNDANAEVCGSPEIFIAVINEEDWAESWKKYFKPIPVGKNILICPVWEEVPTEYKSRSVFKIDPGMSFGTGTHETTRLCAAALEKYMNRGDIVLDLGCGSGILSIIAMILRARSAVAVDIDENSARIALENVRLNNVSHDNYKVYTGNVLTDNKLRDDISVQKYDLILMNIIPDVIVPLLPFVKKLLSSEGFAVLSGIIGKYLPDVEKAVKACGLDIIENTSENDWQCVVVQS